MSDLVEGVLRSSAVLAIALGALPLLRRHSAALRHCVVAGAIVAAGMVAPLGRIAPEWTVRLPDAAPAPLADASAAPVVTPAGGLTDGADTPLDVARLAIAIWLLGVVVGLGALAAAFLRVRRLAAKAVPMTDATWVGLTREVTTAAGLRRTLTILQTDAQDVLATFGVHRPRLLVPAGARGWSDGRVRAVLRHEVAHVERRDWLVQVLADVVCIVHWYNPLFWIACRRLRIESEQACDDAVLRSGIAAHDYAQHLLDIARAFRPARTPVHAAIPMARPSTLRRRIAAMLNHRLCHDSLSRRAVFAVVVALVGLALPAATLRAIQHGPLPLAGFVYDPTGAVLPGATLTLEDPEQNQAQTVSDATGRFEFDAVEAGRYVLGVSLPGFRPLTQTIDLALERDWHRAVTLQVGDVRETIVVRTQRLHGSSGASAEPARVRVGGNVRPPRKLRDVPPVYPQSMQEAGLEGVVPLEAIIGRTGSVQSVRVLTAGVHPDFAQAAIDAVQQWLFDPTLLNGEPVEVVMTVSVEFDLED